VSDKWAAVILVAFFFAMALMIGAVAWSEKGSEVTVVCPNGKAITVTKTTSVEC